MSISNTSNRHRISSKERIFQKIASSASIFTSQSSWNDPVCNPSVHAKYKRFRSRHDIRQFWKKLISEQMILVKMEKQYRKLNPSRSGDLTPCKRANLTFGYSEITPCLKEVDRVWSGLLSLASESTCVPLEKIRQTVLNGIPQAKRDSIWLWLSRQYQKRHQESIKTLHANSQLVKMNAPYRELIKEPNIHQHAILLDLGRTFPNHVHFNEQYGAGQLALFNVLKAYANLDPEVGYCQGLSFIVAVLLIHVDNDEETAFELLKHLLINLDLRGQYKQDMLGLQKYMYQMTRVLSDNQPEVFAKFDGCDMHATLYCAPWFLTLFTSQFEMGFAARVFDFMFAEGVVCLFKIALAIIDVHKAVLVHDETFEEVITFLKLTVPEMSLIQTEQIVNRSVQYDLQHAVDVYGVEFEVFHEQMANAIDGERSRSQTPVAKPAAETRTLRDVQMNRVEEINKSLKDFVENLLSKLENTKVSKQNRDDLIYKLQNENNQLKYKIETLEMERNVFLKTLHGPNFDTN